MTLPKFNIMGVIVKENGFLRNGEDDLISGFEEIINRRGYDFGDTEGGDF